MLHHGRFPWAMMIHGRLAHPLALGRQPPPFPPLPLRLGAMLPSPHAIHTRLPERNPPAAAYIQ